MPERVDFKGDAAALKAAQAIEKDIGRRLAATIERASKVLSSPEKVRDALASMLSAYHGGAAVVIVPIDTRQRSIVVVDADGPTEDMLVVASRVQHAALTLRHDLVTVAMPDGVGERGRFELYATIDGMVRDLQKGPPSINAQVRWSEPCGADGGGGGARDGAGGSGGQ